MSSPDDYFEALVSVGWVDEARTKIGVAFGVEDMTTYEASMLLCDAVGFITAHAAQMMEEEGEEFDMPAFASEALMRIMEAYVAMRRRGS